MKRRFVIAVLVFVLAFSACGMLSSFAADDPTVSVTVNKDGTITVTAVGTFTQNDWVGIYRSGETYDATAGGVTSLLWWYLPVGEDQTVSVTYPGTNEGITVRSDNRPAELEGGTVGGALQEGEYFALILGGDDPDTAYDERSAEFDFEITDEAEEQPTEKPTEEPTAEPTAEPTEAPTEAPTEKPAENTASVTPTPKVTVTPSPAPTKDTAADTSGGNTVLWIIIAAAAVVIVAAVVVVIVIKKKKK